MIIQVINLSSRQVYDIDVSRNSENQMTCPECSHNRRKKHIKCFSFNLEKQVGYCNHCESTFVKYEPYEKREYIKPTFTNFTKLSDNIVKWFEKRGISQRTLLAMKITQSKEFMPQIGKERNCIVFPFFKGDELVNIKYRDAEKNFKLVSGAELIWYNYNAIQKAINDGKPLVITEGECFTGETEVLTESGWIRFDELNHSEKIFQFEKDNMLSLATPLAFVEKNYDGDLIELTSKGFYSLTTENHNYIVCKRRSEDYKKVKAKHLFDNKTDLSIPRCGFTKEDCCNLSDNQLRLMIALSADFTFRKQGDIYGSFKKQRKIERIEYLLKDLNVRFNKSVNVNTGYTSFFIHRHHGLNYCSKLFDHSLISKLSFKQCRVIINELIHWDGNTVPNREQIEYSSKEIKNATFIQTIAHLSGYVSTIIDRKNQYGKWFKVSILFKKRTSNTQALKKKKIAHNGKVYCVQVPSGGLMVRHNRVISICGNCDALSVIQAGYEYAISVPNGASVGKMDYFDSSLDELNKVKEFIIAVDNDLKGIELKNTLVSRLGVERCRIANMKAHKDMNEVLQEEGDEEVRNIIQKAKLIKIDDIYEVDDFQNELDSYFEHGLPQGKKIGIDDLDDKIRWLSSRLAIFTGIPGSGKSEFIDFVSVKLNILYGWKIGYYAPEAMPLPLHFSGLFAKFVGKKYDKKVITESEKNTGEDYISKNVFWVAPNEDFKLDEILTRFEYMVKAKGVKIFIIDPFNRIETEQNNASSAENMLFIKKVLQKLIIFVKKFDVLLFLIAHPTKLQVKQDGTFPMPTMYNISGSADFWNMTDYGGGVRREQDDETKKFLSYGQVAVQKAKVNYTMGQTGLWEFQYNINNGRYESKNKPLKADYSFDWDNSNWITKAEYVEPPTKPIPQLTTQQAFFEDEDEDEDERMPF